MGWVPVGGFRVCVMHAGGLESCDYHTSLPLVAIGDHVTRGQPVALVGMTGLTTGPHVHWEAKLNGRIVNPLDQKPPPLISLPSRGEVPLEPSRPQRIVVTIGILMGLLLASLDQTIVGTALPR